MTYPLLARLLLELELLERLRAPGLERLELLLLEGPLVGDPGVLLDLFPLASLAFLLGLLALLAVVLFHLAQHLVLLLQRDALALALLASLHHLDDACRGGGEGRKEPAPGGTEVSGLGQEAAPDLAAAKSGDQAMYNAGLLWAVIGCWAVFLPTLNPSRLSKKNESGA